MDNINWKSILSHPSEMVRIDEQLRLLQLQLLSDFKEPPFDWTASTEEATCTHLNIIKNFRNAINMFGCHYFNVAILSEEESVASTSIPIYPQPQLRNNNFFEDETAARGPKEKLMKYMNTITETKNTEKVFQTFLVTFFDNYVNVDNKYFILNSDEEKERIMLEIIKRIN